MNVLKALTTVDSVNFIENMKMQEICLGLITSCLLTDQASISKFGDGHGNVKY